MIFINRFIVAKESERAEVKVQEGPKGFPFLKHQKYIFRYSFQAKEGMRVAKRFTHLGQLKGSKDRRMIKGDPIYSLTANNEGLNVRFSNRESIEDYHDGMEKHLDWDKAAGEWVHVKITTVFGESMEVLMNWQPTNRCVIFVHIVGDLSTAAKFVNDLFGLVICHLLNDGEMSDVPTHNRRLPYAGHNTCVHWRYDSGLHLRDPAISNSATYETSNSSDRS